MWGLWESICLLQEGRNGNISCETTHDAVHDCRGLRGTDAVTHEALWSFLALPVHGDGERTLEGKDCVQPACDINSTLNSISDCGLHVVLQ